MTKNKKGTADWLLTRKHFKDLNPTEKQKQEIQKVLDFLNSPKNNIEQILKRQATIKILRSMIKSGVDDLYIRRIIRKQKYCKNKVTLYGMVLLYGKKGYEYWNDYKDKQSKTNTYEYKKQKYGWTKEKFNEYNKSRAVTIDNLILKHGEEKGKEIWNNYINRQRYTNTLEYYYEKYGKENGYKEWILYNSSKSNNLESYIKKHGEEKGKEKFIKFWEKNHYNFYSKISQELFWGIYKELSLYDKQHTYFATLNKEFGRMNGTTYYFYDFVITNKNICIEFNGDVWHANPSIYFPNETPKLLESMGYNITATEIWKKDEIKVDFLKNLGYNVLIVWENDYIKNKDKMIEKCLKEIYDK